MRQLPDVVGTHGALTHKAQPSGKGVLGALKLERKRPALSSWKCMDQSEALESWFGRLAERLRFTKVCCGDWTRVCTKAATYGQGLTGVLLDPPYSRAMRDENIYSNEVDGVSDAVRIWAIENGENPLMRIALCGYEGEHAMPSNWTCVAWKAAGGYANRNPENQNAHKERIWFSPHCLQPEAELFDLPR